MGPKFNVPYTKKNLPVNHLLSEVRDLLQSLPEEQEEQKGLIRHEVVRVITSHKLRFESQYTAQDIFALNYKKEAKQFLSENPNIIITKTDKENITCAGHVQ